MARGANLFRLDAVCEARDNVILALLLLLSRCVAGIDDASASEAGEGILADPGL